MSVPSRDKSVLVLEDEPIVAMLVEDMLNELGYENVLSVGDSASALATAADNDLAFAILDVNIAGARSFTVADELTRRGIPFVFATGYGRGSIEGDHGNVPTLQKPFLLSDLETIIGKLA
ncbi:response regulator [Prosthecomicrobium sp. N25]|uniref:response regulator n=1 Tax=Prosthecomicrobium sp. N25 TaxID=3129254 RepID=UPI003078A244